jgi:hypothetical protein
MMARPSGKKSEVNIRSKVRGFDGKLCSKIDQKQDCQRELFYNFISLHSSIGIVLMIVSHFGKKNSKVYMRSKVRCFDGNGWYQQK